MAYSNLEYLFFSTHTLLVIGHLFGLLLGLGGATLLYGYLAKNAFKPIHPEVIETFHFIAIFVTLGLVLLWITGFGFLLEYSLFAPEKLQNQKIYAKLTIVTILTLNGLFVHSYVLNKIISPGLILIRLPYKTKVHLALLATTSGVSWYFAFCLGVIKEYNNTVSYGALVLTYLVVLLFVFASVLYLISFLEKHLHQMHFNASHRNNSLHPQNYYNQAMAPQPLQYSRNQGPHQPAMGMQMPSIVNKVAYERAKTQQKYYTGT
ncbi:MAG: hypothetical protein AAF228_12610 [Pseudomonadota bacterium]